MQKSSVMAFLALAFSAGLLLVSGCVTGGGKTAAVNAGLPLAAKGRALVSIVVNSAGAIPAEKTAAKELAAYLTKLTGATFATVEEAAWSGGTPAIYVGDTALAHKLGLDAKGLWPEEAVLKTVAGNLVLTGGQPRGTLYAVYDLLENTLGVRWYTPWAEQVPQVDLCAIPSLDRRVRPHFMFRSHYTHLGDPRFFPAEPWQWFNAHNRINNGGGQGAVLGGEVQYGGRISGGHGFAPYLPVDKYFKDHPEYYSMRDGKRVTANGVDGNHACLTNPEVLKIIIAEVKKDIQEDPDALCYTVAVNDGGNPTICDCPRCREVARQYGATEERCTDAGLLLWFVNQVADAIREEHPDKFIRTLAYNPTGKPPRNIRARDNVIVQVCVGAQCELVWLPRGSDSSGPKALRAWAPFATHLWLWDYACPCYYAPAFFRPLTWKMDEQMKFCQFLGSPDGMFQENEFMFEDSIFTQFYEMNMWIYARLCQDPAADVNGLIADFLNGYYGAAGPALQQYVDAIHARLPRFQYRFFDYAFMSTAQNLFDQAEAAVKHDAERLGRVRDLRLQLDLAALVWRNTIIRDYLAQGGTLERYPWRIPVLKARLLETLDKTTNPYILANAPRPGMKDRKLADPVRGITRRYVEEMSAGVDYTPLPPEFAALPPDRVIDLTAPVLASGCFPHVVPDPDAALGLAMPWMRENQLPMPIAFYRSIPQPPLPDCGGVSIPAKEIPGKGYHCYKGPRFPLSEWTYVYLTPTWEIQKHLFSLFDPLHPEQEWEVYVSMKFAGPQNPHGDPQAPNGVFFDRMILVQAEKPATGAGR